MKAQAEYYSYAVNKKKFQDGKRKLLSAVAAAEKKVEKRLAAALDKLEECASAETVKLNGELITANIYAVQRGMKSFETVNYYDENCAKITVELDPLLTPAQNAQKYYKKYAKLKRTALSVSGQRDESLQKAEYLKSIKYNVELAENLLDLTESQEELIALSLMAPPQKERAGKGAKSKKVEEENPCRTYLFKGYTVL